MSIVRKILEEKKDDHIYSVPANTPILQALKVMADADIGAVLVTEGDKFVGIFSERDYAREVELKGRKDTLVGSVMVKELVSVKPETSVYQCMEIMTKYRIRHLPVISDEQRIIGVISIGDAVLAKIEDEERTIDELENYILGTGYGR
jgi:CBS domain-containing protein